MNWGEYVPAAYGERGRWRPAAKREQRKKASACQQSLHRCAHRAINLLFRLQSGGGGLGPNLSHANKLQSKRSQQQLCAQRMNRRTGRCILSGVSAQETNDSQ